MADPRPSGLDGRVMESLANLVQDLGSTLELDEVLQRVADGIKCHIDHDTFAVLLIDDLGRELHFRFATGFPEEVVEKWRFGMGQGLVGHVAQTQEQLHVGDVREDSRYIGAAPELRSELAIPLVVKGRTIGVLDVGSKNPHHFTPTHRQLLTFVAGHLANGIENARLYESVRDQARMLSLLHESSRELTSILDREKLLRKVAELVKRLVDYQLFLVLLWNEEAQELQHGFALGFADGFCRKDGFPLGHGVTGTAAALRQPVLVPNVHLYPHYTDCGHAVEVCSELAVPLVFKDRLIGVLDLESTEYNAFTKQHEQMLSTLASYIAVAIENARLYECVSEGERRLEEDLDTAREIQKGLLPATVPPATAGIEVGFAYKPARQLGGDFYDLLSYGAERTAAVVGDVAGKGTPAALLASMAVGIMRGHIVEHPCGPAEMLGHMNHHLTAHPVEGRFVAMAFGVYDDKDHTFTVANAGLPRPLLVRGAKAEEIRVEGLPLGMFPGATYEQSRSELGPGDVVVICSDGIRESLDRHHEEFGARRLQAQLVELAARQAQEMADGLLRAAEHFVGEAAADDRTVVVLKVV